MIIEGKTYIGQYYFSRSADDSIGNGSYGYVYKCTNSNNPDQKLCIKEIPLLKSPVQREKQQRECDILKDLVASTQNNPNLIKLEYIEQKDGKIYIITELCDTSLAKLRDEMKKYKNNFSPEEALYIVSQIANGYRALIERKFLHRDIKPDNILYNKHGNIFKITDFGFSREEDKNQMYSAKCSDQLGSPQIILKNYDQGLDIKYTNKTDIYSLGLTFYYLIFGYFPYKDKPTSDLLKAIKKLKDNPIRIQINQQNAIYKQIFELIENMVMYAEEDRISWEDLLNHKLIQNAAPYDFAIYLQGNLNQQSFKLEQVQLYQLQNQQKLFKPFVLLYELNQNYICPSYSCYSVAVLYRCVVELYYELGVFQKNQNFLEILVDLCICSILYCDHSIQYHYQYNEQLNLIDEPFMSDTFRLKENMEQVFFQYNKIIVYLQQNNLFYKSQLFPNGSEMQLYRNNLNHFQYSNQEQYSQHQLQLLYLLKQLNKLASNSYSGISEIPLQIQQEIDYQEKMRVVLQS